MDAARSELTLSVERLRKMMEDMKQEMRIGLASDEPGASSLKMIQTFVTHLPIGDEKGIFYAIDLGGSNFRVLRLMLDGHGGFAIEKSEYKLTKQIMESDADSLFGFIADCVVNMAPPITTTPILLGFTFSFPVKQTALEAGILISWTKGFSATGCVGEDVGRLMQEALNSRGLTMRVSAIVNDTVGTLMARAATDRECHVGVIFGTGTNACYFERRANIPKWSGAEHDGMVVNMEWGGLGDGKCSTTGESLLPWTKWDQAVDDQSLHPKEQLFEKMISGKYQGEIVRQLIVDMCAQGLLFQGTLPENLAVVDGFATHLLSDIEADLSDDLVHTRVVLERVCKQAPTLDECKLIRELCQLVSTRAARLSAAACVTVVEQVCQGDLERGVTIAVDGSVFRLHPTFREHLDQCVDELRDPRSKKPKFVEAEDGSGKGAALVVAATR